MALPGSRLEPYPVRGRHQWSARRVTGWIVIGIAIVYAVLLVDAAAGFVWWINDDYQATDTFEYDAFAPLRLLTLPGSFFVPRLVVDGADIPVMGVYLGVVAAAQAGLIACLGWALVVRTRRDRIAPGVVALLLVGVIAAVNVVAHEPKLQLPDRSDPAVAAEEARLAPVVAASSEFPDGGATCEVRLIARDGATAFVNAACVHGRTEMVAPARVTGTTATFPTENRHEKSMAELFPEDVRRALVDQYDAVQP